MPTSYPNTRAFSNIAHQRDAGDAFAALPVHVLITHVLSSGNLPDPSDLARLRAVSREMRDAVAATGRRLYQLVAWKVIQFGDLSGLQFLHQRGDLDDILNSLCRLAAGGDNSKYLSGCARMTSRGTKKRPRARHIADTSRCCGGRARTVARGTRARATTRQGAGTYRCCSGRARTAARGRNHVREGGNVRASQGATVGARERLPVERRNVSYGGVWQAPRNDALVARERVPTVMRLERKLRLP